jgi:hypothetical protein
MSMVTFAIAKMPLVRKDFFEVITDSGIGGEKREVSVLKVRRVNDGDAKWMIQSSLRIGASVPSTVAEFGSWRETGPNIAS